MNPSDWTADTLREWIRDQFTLRDAQLERTREDMERRLSEMNELRHQIERERNHYVTAAEYNRRHEELEARWEALDRWRYNLTGRMVGLASVGAVLIAATSALVTRLLT